MADRWTAEQFHQEHRRLHRLLANEFCLDIEVSNRCNAGCDFCPRDRTPHEGTMGPEVFDQVLRRAVEFRDTMADRLAAVVKVSLCGLGEATLNPRLARYLRQVSEAGFEPQMCSNGSLLTEELTRSLLDAGLRGIFINCGSLGDDYTDVYKVPFERLRDNVVRFLELADGRCALTIVLVDHRQDEATVDEVRRFWQELGITRFFPSPLLNRAGSVDVEGMSFAAYPEHRSAEAMFTEDGIRPICAAPFVFPFIGYDGNYYLCSSDWEKRTPMGSVHDRSILSLLEQKTAHVTSRAPICADCCHDPTNALTMALREDARPGAEGGRADMLHALHTERDGAVRELLDAQAKILADHPDPGPAAERRVRRLLPVRAE